MSDHPPRNYFNQQGVGRALSQYDRESYFLTTKTPPCAAGTTPDACYNTTKAQLAYDLNALQVDHVDLVLIHGSSGDHNAACAANACDLDYAQWRAYEAFYRAGKVKAIGLSNYCVSCLECLLNKATIAPTVNQVQLHVGMGPDPNTQALLKMNKENKIVIQAYSPLGDGKLISDPDLQSIGKKYGKSSAQVALKWIVSQGLPVATKSDSVAYLQQDFDLFSWNLTVADMTSLNSKAGPVDRPSWSCAK